MSIAFSCSSQKALHYHVTNQNTPTQSRLQFSFRSKALSCVGIPENTRSVSVVFEPIWTEAATWLWHASSITFGQSLCTFVFNQCPGLWIQFVTPQSWESHPCLACGFKFKNPKNPCFDLLCFFSLSEIHMHPFSSFGHVPTDWVSFLACVNILSRTRKECAWGDFLFHGQVGSCGVRISNSKVIDVESGKEGDIGLLKTSLLRSAACTTSYSIVSSQTDGKKYRLFRKAKKSLFTFRIQYVHNYWEVTDLGRSTVHAGGLRLCLARPFRPKSVWQCGTCSATHHLCPAESHGNKWYYEPMISMDLEPILMQLIAPLSFVQKLSRFKVCSCTHFDRRVIVTLALYMLCHRGSLSATPANSELVFCKSGAVMHPYPLVVRWSATWHCADSCPSVFEGV